MYKYIKNIAAIMALCLSLKAKDFVVDCDKCVIEVIFTDEEVEHFKKEMGEENFYTLADDANYYAYALREYLKSNSLKIKHISRLDTHYARLIFPNANIDITKLKWLYEYYLYQKGKKPHKLMNIATPQNEINEYFNITNPKYPKESE
ncbi:hypothetical protein [Helicobacter bilis]|uniref:Uncharacterized protein n=2 Tax=Helicobacter bilis TaxID=37372 RepID=A0A6D2C6Y0_9HELI|nr:hypothetical protein [Helicobacter bilis]EMZ38470.1 hypothetical protein C826_01506 [Helicobacter bilis WiWa]TLE04749.1 hypothetical protein LS77_005025 [Helicobacter bilis]TLE06018.1 hypothetical protein LS76_003995 [Helicobacter bilis]